MAYETKPGNGALFKNDRKEKETHPDYKGDININGTNYWLSAWLKATKDGKKYMSLSAKPKEDREETKPQTLAQKQPEKFDDDDALPF
jgi:uncharacterized protein (DUF736 family)